MTTEIRDYGDKKLIVVFTRDDAVFKKLKEWKSCKRVVFYEIWKDCDPRRATTAGVDLYFEKKEEKRIRKALRLPEKTKLRSEAQREQTKRLMEAGRRYRFSRGIQDVEKVGVLAGKN